MSDPLDDSEYPPEANIMRHHEAAEREFVSGDPALIEAISEHLEKHLGPIDRVFHEIVSDYVHIDVHYIAATADRPWHILVTSGMSEKPMHVPDGLPEDFSYAELMISLPATWDLSEAAMKDQAHYWPMYWLKTLARLPHQYRTWLCDGHTVPNGDPAAPLGPGTSCTGLIVLPTMELEADAMQLAMPDGRIVRFWSLLPLHTDEMEYKLKHGSDALLELLEAAQVTSVVDPARASVIPPRRRWWPF